jgi:transcriptional regulator with XRE-family HTH domain
VDVSSFDGRRIRLLLLDHNTTQRRLAAEAGLSPEHLNRILRGRGEPGELALYKLRRGLERLGLLDGNRVADQAREVADVQPAR